MQAIVGPIRVNYSQPMAHAPSACSLATSQQDGRAIKYLMKFSIRFYSKFYDWLSGICDHVRNKCHSMLRLRFCHLVDSCSPSTNGNEIDGDDGHEKRLYCHCRRIDCTTPLLSTLNYIIQFQFRCANTQFANTTMLCRKIKFKFKAYL